MVCRWFLIFKEFFTHLILTKLYRNFSATKDQGTSLLVTFVKATSVLLFTIIFLDPKFFWYKKIYPKCFWVQNFLYLRIFLDPKICLQFIFTQNVFEHCIFLESIFLWGLIFMLQPIFNNNSNPIFMVENTFELNIVQIS